MNEKRIKRREKIIAGGRGKYLLRQVMIAVFIAIFFFLFLRLLHIAGLVHWKLDDIGDVIATIIGLGLAGLMSGFDSWDRLLESHEKYSTPEVANEI